MYPSPFILPAFVKLPKFPKLRKGFPITGAMMEPILIKDVVSVELSKIIEYDVPPSDMMVVGPTVILPPPVTLSNSQSVVIETSPELIGEQVAENAERLAVRRIKYTHKINRFFIFL